MTNICFVRHGQTDWNLKRKIQGTEDIPLNATGIKEAQLSANYLGEQMSWDLIISSPLKRASHTAEIIREHCGLPAVIKMEEFVEKDFGEASGMLVSEIEKKYNLLDIPGSETFEQISARMRFGLEKVQQDYPNHNVIIVSHGMAIKTLLLSLSEGKLDTNLRLKNACLNHISFDQEKWVLNKVNVADHLETIQVNN